MGKHIGQVKWFNNKIGYGFLTILNEDKDKDVFVHHMNIKPLESNYRTLKIGEFVEFELDDKCEGQHNEQAVNVTGICGRELQCDWVHRMNKKKKFSKHKHDEDEDEDVDEDVTEQ